MPDLTAWRALVDKELAGASFDKLIQRTPEGVAIEPLYTERTVDPGLPGAAPFIRGAQAAPARFKICMRVDPPEQRRPGALLEDLDGGADALWVPRHDGEAIALASRRNLPVIHGDDASSSWSTARVDPAPVMAKFERELQDHGAIASSAPGWLDFDFISRAVRGQLVTDGLTAMARAMIAIANERMRSRSSGGLFRVSGLAFHEAGADTADELALMLSTAAVYVRALADGGLAIDRALRTLWTQVSIGRDTFGELCKLRALRVVWHKLAVAAGAPEVAPPMLHAVCSTRAQSQRDPWVNMLRVTTQVFAAALGGADLITPLAFDEALGPPSAAGRRAARNAALVLREESSLGRVIDPAGGSYYLEARTDQLAREAWRRFTEIEREGGIVPLIMQGKLTARLEAAWAQRAAAIARRKEPVLGVSEFANLDEKLPSPLPPAPLPVTVSVNGQLLPHLAHRDAEAFEALRARVEAAPRDVALIQLGPPAEHRARAGFAEGFFAVAGLRTAPREFGQVRDDPRSRDAAAKVAGAARDAGHSLADAGSRDGAGRVSAMRDGGALDGAASRDVAAKASGAGRGLDGAASRDVAAKASAVASDAGLALDIACLCGSDERYAAEAVQAARALKAAGARRVVLAGRPGPLEADLRGAGVDSFIYVGCDLVATLEEILA